MVVGRTVNELSVLIPLPKPTDPRTYVYFCKGKLCVMYVYRIYRQPLHQMQAFQLYEFLPDVYIKKSVFL